MLNDICDRLDRALARDSVLNDIRDRLDLEIGCDHGLASAIDGLECLEETRHAGVTALAEALIERLVEISAAISDVVDGVATSPPIVPWRRTTDALFRARAARHRGGAGLTGGQL